MKNRIDPLDYAGEITKRMKQGILLTTKADGKVNTMTIGWGHIGFEWGKNIFVAYVRKSRHTLEMLEKNAEFTVNIPADDSCKEIIRFCGTKSGRDFDKVRELGLTLEEPEKISVPGIRQLPLTLECKVIYRSVQDPAALPQEIRDRYYSGADTDNAHLVFYGEILDSYIIV